MAICYLSLGSNLGDRIGYIQQATCLLGETEGVTIVRTSAFYETEPVEMQSENWFVNAVVEVKTTLTPQLLLEQCQRVERQLGRRGKWDGKTNTHEDRTIDIDILLYGKDIVDDGDITIPHKRMHQRAFTLVPLLELIPDYIHPVAQKSMVELHEALENPEMVLLYGGG
jgi:2-amino-4-hydroxy-6-hydroxymethyldihydropteridine diphosphokinase